MTLFWLAMIRWLHIVCAVQRMHLCNLHVALGRACALCVHIFGLHFIWDGFLFYCSGLKGLHDIVGC